MIQKLERSGKVLVEVDEKEPEELFDQVYGYLPVDFFIISLYYSFGVHGLFLDKKGRVNFR